MIAQLDQLEISTEISSCGVFNRSTGRGILHGSRAQGNRRETIKYIVAVVGLAQSMSLVNTLERPSLRQTSCLDQRSQNLTSNEPCSLLNQVPSYNVTRSSSEVCSLIIMLSVFDTAMLSPTAPDGRVYLLCILEAQACFSRHHINL
jgi:hypothetical protein